MTRDLKKIFLAVCMMTGVLPATAQEKGIVSYTILCPDTARVGDTISVSVRFNVTKGWYVYAPVDVNEAQQMIVTNVIFYPLPASVRRVGVMSLPVPRQKGSYVVYQGGDHTFTQQLLVTASGKTVIRGKFTYQACNNATCYPPSADKFQKEMVILED